MDAGLLELAQNRETIARTRTAEKTPHSSGGCLVDILHSISESSTGETPCGPAEDLKGEAGIQECFSDMGQHRPRPNHDGRWWEADVVEAKTKKAEISPQCFVGSDARPRAVETDPRYPHDLFFRVH